MSYGFQKIKWLSDAVSKEVVKKTVYCKLDKKVNNLKNKIPGTNSLIHISQYNTNKQNLEEKNKRF